MFREALTTLDRRIVLATQQGLPLTPRPYHTLADQLGVEVDLIRQRLQHMLDTGVIRRIGAVPNHYTLGFRANGMSVWDVDDERITELGRRVGRLEFVSHAYHRPRRLPEWPYNLFAMVHGKHRAEVSDKVDAIARILGDAQRRYEVLFSTRVLKKTGLRLLQDEPAPTKNIA
jgi:DNA-binding Lrp family transcriptional regulator